jgi:hypothetical protein
MTRVCRLYQRIDRNPLDLLPLLAELTTHLALGAISPRSRQRRPRARAVQDDSAVVVPAMQRDLSTGRVLTVSSSTASRSPTWPGCAPPVDPARWSEAHASTFA